MRENLYRASRFCCGRTVKMLPERGDTVQSLECFSAQSEGIARSAEDRRSASTVIDGVQLPTGVSPAVAAVNRLIQQVAPYDSTVLILGESGTGKTICAEAVAHALGARIRDMPLTRERIIEALMRGG